MERRCYSHKNKLLDGFSKKYNLKMLVYYEGHASVETAILREKTIKRWPREYKINSIIAMNPEWKDLSSEWTPKSMPEIPAQGRDDRI